MGLPNDAASEAPRSWSRQGLQTNVTTVDGTKAPASQGKKRTFIQLCTCIRQKPKIMARKNSAKIPMSPSVNIKKKVAIEVSSVTHFPPSGYDETIEMGNESSITPTDNASSPSPSTI